MNFTDIFKKISPFWFIIVALVFLLWVPHLLALGMFMDGIYDALVAENIYKGNGTFWAMQTVHYSQPGYYGNPPLAMWILATYYRIFGDSYVVERIYSFTCAILQLCLIVILWRLVFNNDLKAKHYTWLPCLLWLFSPLIGWCYSNNLLENTMSLFTTSAIILSMAYIISQKHILITSLLVSLVILLAFITKGPVALFPLAFPILMVGYNTYFKVKKAVAFTALQIIFFLLLFFILFSYEQPQNFLKQYFECQLKKSLVHTGADGSWSYKIFEELLIATSVSIGLALIRFWSLTNFKSVKAQNDIAIRMVLMGLCGSLPIALSTKQSSFYLLPALTPFSIGAAAYLLPMAQWIEEKLQRLNFNMIIKSIAVIVTLVSILLCMHYKGVSYRDTDILGDLKSANELLQNESVVRADWPLYGEWSLRAYFLRLYGKKLCMPNENAPTHYYMTKPGQRGDGLQAEALKIYTGKAFDLYKQ